MVQPVFFSSLDLFSSLSRNFGLEFLFLVIILFASIMIFHSTKDAYSFSKHGGIRHFRFAFLFLALAFLFRFFFYLFAFLSNAQVVTSLDLPLRMLGSSSIFVYTFMSSISLLSLLFALSFDRLKKRRVSDYSVYIIGGVISAVSIFSYPLLWIIHLSIVALIVYNTLIQRKGGLRSAYLGLAIFWVMSIIGDVRYIPLIEIFRPVLYAALSFIVLFLLLKIVKKI